MVLTKEQKKELAILMKKDAATLTEKEKSALTALKSLAEVEGITLDDAFVAEHATNEVGGDELASIIKNSIAESLKEFGAENNNTEKIIEAVAKALENKDSIKPEDMMNALKSALENHKVDADAIAEAVNKNIPKELLTKEQAKSLYDQWQKDEADKKPGQKTMQFDAGNENTSHLICDGRGKNLPLYAHQFLNVIKGKKADDGVSAEMLIKARDEQVHKSFIRNVLNGVDKGLFVGQKSVMTTTTAQAVNPTDLYTYLDSRLYLNSDLAAALIQSEFPMTSDPMKFPIKTTDVRFRLGTEAPATAPAGTSPTLEDRIWQTRKFIGITEYSYEASEDVIISLLTTLLDSVAIGYARCMETAYINGDTSSTHMDADVVDSDDPRRAYNGFRKLAIAGDLVKSLATGGLTRQQYVSLKNVLGKYGMALSDLAIIVSPNGYNSFLNVDETLTIDKYGQNARIVTGSVDTFMRVPVITSEAMPMTDTNGKVSATADANKFDSMILVNLRQFRVGVKREWLLEQDEDKGRQVRRIIGSARRAFAPADDCSKLIPTLAYGTNMPLL